MFVPSAFGGRQAARRGALSSLRPRAARGNALSKSLFNPRDEADIPRLIREYPLALGYLQAPPPGQPCQPGPRTT